MNCWEILGIAETDNQREIKKAYAKKLKEIDMNSDVAEFQRLKMAFDEALVLSKDLVIPENSSGSDSDLFIEDLFSESKNSIANWEIPIKEEKSDSKLEFTIEKEKLMANIPFDKKFADMLSQKAYFNEVEAWKELAEPVMEQGIDQIMEAQTFLANFLKQNFSIVSRNIRLFLIDFCQLEHETIDPLLAKGQVDFIKEYPDFGFDFWQEIDKSQRERYFIERDQVHQLISSKVPLSFLQQRVADCLQDYENDPYMNLLAAYILVLADFRLEDGNSLNQLQLLLAKGGDSHHWNYLKQYLLFQTVDKVQFLDEVYSLFFYNRIMKTNSRRKSL